MSRFLSPLGISLRDRHIDPAFSAAWSNAAQAGQASLGSTINGRDVTDRLSGWGHNYFCPLHTLPLHFDETKPDTHRCVQFDHVLKGEQYDTGWATVRNERLLEHLYASAIVGSVTGDATHIHRASSILLDLAGVYLELPLHGRNVGQGRLTAQSLEEAVAATSLSRSYALVEGFMTDRERQSVRQGLFLPMVEVIESQMMNRPHNIEVWHLSGLASLAVVLEDPALASSTLRRPFGLEAQLAEGLREDGWWFEGSPGYHFYMLRALMNAAESFRALGLNTSASDALERMLLTPIEAARNDLTVPAFNDSALATSTAPGIAGYADLYVRGNRLLNSERLKALMASRLADAFDRTSQVYLIYGGSEPAGRPAASEPWPTDRKSLFPQSGYAVLRQSGPAERGGPDTCVYLKFGPHGGGHGHPDKLMIDLMIDGARVMPDQGAPVYTNPLHHPWYKQTWSHSTVVLDRISQPPIAGRLLGHRQVGPDQFGYIDGFVAFGNRPDREGVDVLWHVDDPASLAAYAGTTMRRVILMTPPALNAYLLDLVIVDTPYRKTIDLMTHVRGAWASEDRGRRAPERLLLPGFENVWLSAAAEGRDDYILADTGRRWSRWHAGAQDVMTATTPSHPSHERCASTVQRVVDTHARFVAALPLGATQPKGLRTDGETVSIDFGTSVHRWTISDTQGEAARLQIDTR